MVGPWVYALVSTSNGFGLGEEVGPDGSVWGRSGGGSMIEGGGDFGTMGSGRSAIVSSAEDVSIVICLVGGGDFRVV
jgi:hypothetical protein